MQKAYIIGMFLGCTFLINSLEAQAAKSVTCPTEITTGTEFPMTDANKVTWHNSNSINIDYKTVCSWKTVKATKRKEGNVCTYSAFSDCSVAGTVAGTVFYLTDYKPVIKAAPKK
jgi:hypothetical protein